MKFVIRKIYYKLLRMYLGNEKFAKTVNVKIASKKGVKVGEECRFYSTSFSSEPYLICIGNHVTITEGVQFITHDGAAWVLRGLKDDYKNINILGKINIGNNVFIGVNSIILPGVEVGDNCIIAAGSVVSKSFGANLVIGGNPARVIKPIDDYIERNKKYLVNTKNLSNEEKKNYILKEMEISQFRKK